MKTALCCFPSGRQGTKLKEDQTALRIVKPDATDIPPEGDSPVTAKEWNLGHINKALSDALSQLLAVAEDSEAIPILVNKPEVQVYGKDSGRGFLTKTCWTLPYSSRQFIDFLNQDSLRCTWDSNVESRSELAQLPNSVRVFYERYKKVALVSQRDVVIASASHKSGDVWTVVSTSINSEYPSEHGALRATMYVGGHVIKEVESGCEVVSVSEMDFRGALPVALLVKMSAMAMPGYVKSLQSALEKYTQS